MSIFETASIPVERTTVAPDGSDVRVLLGLPGGGMAHFHLRAGDVSRAITHRTVEEIWLVIAGRGQIWRRQGERDEVVELESGVCVSIPADTHFQFRAAPTESISIVGVTMPPWPGETEAIPSTGPWRPTVG